MLAKYCLAALGLVTAYIPAHGDLQEIGNSSTHETLSVFSDFSHKSSPKEAADPVKLISHTWSDCAGSMSGTDSGVCCDELDFCGGRASNCDSCSRCKGGLLGLGIVPALDGAHSAQ